MKILTLLCSRSRPKKDLPFLKFGDSDALLTGNGCCTIGNLFALDHTVTAGILSAKNRNIHAGPFDNFLQTDASINPGNSGGPLLNMKGEVIGINTAIIASGQGIGFAIPSNMAAGIVEQIKSGKKVSRGWIGVTIQDVDENTAKALGMEHPSGALVPASWTVNRRPRPVSKPVTLSPRSMARAWKTPRPCCEPLRPTSPALR